MIREPRRLTDTGRACASGDGDLHTTLADRGPSSLPPSGPRRRRRTTPTTKPIAPISMEQIAAEFAEALRIDREGPPLEEP